MDLSYIISLIGLWHKIVERSDKVKFQRYKEKGTEIKESGQLAKAANFIKKPLILQKKTPNKQKYGRYSYIFT